MFARDFNLLNEIYNNRIVVKEMNLGPQAETSVEGLTPIKRAKVELDLPYQKCDTCEKEEDCESCGGTCGMESGVESEEHENADMAKRSLYRLVKLSAMLHDLISHNKHVEPWILTKITDAQRSIESAYGYQDYESFKHQVDSDIENIEEDTEHDLYRSISSNGDAILAKLKRLLATESKETLEGFLLETITALESKN